MERVFRRNSLYQAFKAHEDLVRNPHLRSIPWGAAQERRPPDVTVDVTALISPAVDARCRSCRGACYIARPSNLMSSSKGLRSMTRANRLALDDAANLQAFRQGM